VRCSVLQCAAVCCSVLQCVAVSCSALQCAAVCCSVSQCVVAFCSVLCIVLQCVALCCSVLHYTSNLNICITTLSCEFSRQGNHILLNTLFIHPATQRTAQGDPLCVYRETHCVYTQGDPLRVYTLLFCVYCDVLYT